MLLLGFELLVYGTLEVENVDSNVWVVDFLSVVTFTVEVVLIVDVVAGRTNGGLSQVSLFL